MVALLGLSAAGSLYLFGLAVKQRSEASDFADRATEVEARIVFATETKVLRNPEYTKAQIAFTTEGGSIGPVFAEVIDCPEARVPVDAASVTVVYDPANESDVRLPECLDKGYKLSLALGTVLLALAVAVFMSIRKTRRGAASR